MNLKELKELNETALISLNRYNAEKEEKNTADNGSIKDYYTAKHISAQIEEYNKVFEINAAKLADEIKNFLEEKTGEEYSLNVVLDNKERREIADEFGNKFIETYDYFLVLEHKSKLFDDDMNKFTTTTTIPIAKNRSSIVSNNIGYLGFDESEALESFSRKNVNLLGSNPVYIPNYNNPAPCTVAKKFGMEDFLWDVVDRNVAQKKSKKIEEIKQEISSLEEKQKNTSSDSIEFL